MALTLSDLRSLSPTGFDPPFSHDISTCRSSDKRRQSAARGSVIPARHSVTSPSVTPSDFATRPDESPERLIVMSSRAANARPTRWLSGASLTWWSEREGAFMDVARPDRRLRWSNGALYVTKESRW